MSAQPGWYDQPDGRQRYWDGEAWTQHIRQGSAPTGPQPSVLATSPVQTSEKRPFFTNKGFIVVAAVLALVIVASVFNEKGNQPQAAPVAVAAVTATVTATAVATATATVTAEPTEVPAVEPTDEITLEPTEQPSEEPTQKESPAKVEKFKMPKLIGKNLQGAQDRLQALDSWIMEQEDASGMGRFQILDSNWKVCTQKPKAGKVVSIATVVVLAAVKLDEKCP